MPRSPLNRPLIITQDFGVNAARYPATKGHPGLDLRSPDGDDWFACVTGVFHLIDYKDSWGRWTAYGAAVAVDQGQADGTFVRFLYGHGKNRRKELNNQHIEEGRYLCESGNTGTSTAHHLHFELRHYKRSGRYYDSRVREHFDLIDPKTWFKANKIPFTYK